MIDVLLVLGMHRSGTSAVAGTLSKLGGELPRHLMPAHASNARGFFESSALMSFNDELLASAGTEWSDWRSFNDGWIKSPVADGFRRRAKSLFADEFDGATLPVLKDPRICRFTPFWLDVLRDLEATPRIAMPIRSPLDVARSLKQAHGFPLTHGLLLWLRHVLDAESQTRSLARSIFTWSDFQRDWRGVCGRIATETQLAWPRLSDRSSREIDRFLSKDLVHHDTDHATLVAHADMHEWTLRAYEALLELAAKPFEGAALATLDEVRMLLDQSSKMFGRALIDSEIDLQELRSREQTTSSERDALRARQAQMTAENATALTALTARAEVAEMARREIARERDELSQSLAAALAERDGLGVARVSMEAELQKLQRMLAAAVAERDGLGAARARLETDLRSHRQDLAVKATALTALAARAEAVETARDEMVREKDCLARDLAAALAERDELGAARVGVETALRSRQRELAEATTALAELAACAKAAETARGEIAREKDGLSRKLAAVVAERDELGAAHAGTLAALRSQERDAADKAQALAELATRAEAAETALDEVAGEKDRLTRALASALAARKSLDSDRAALAAEAAGSRRDALESASALAALESRLRSAEAARAEADRENAAHTEARTADAAERQALSCQLVDAEAALAVARADIRRKRGTARLIPNALKRARMAKQLLRSGLFEPEFYRAQGSDSMFAALPGGRKGELAMAMHYLEEGYCRAFRPKPLFDTHWYLEQYGDVRRAGINPVLHYLKCGSGEGRDPGPGFHTAYYLDANPDVRALGGNPLAHYLRYGRQEGRPAMRPIDFDGAATDPLAVAPAGAHPLTTDSLGSSA